MGTRESRRYLKPHFGCLRRDPRRYLIFLKRRYLKCVAAVTAVTAAPVG
jgi:hypothetical protein